MKNYVFLDQGLLSAVVHGLGTKEMIFAFDLFFYTNNDVGARPSSRTFHQCLAIAVIRPSNRSTSRKGHDMSAVLVHHHSPCVSLTSVVLLISLLSLLKLFAFIVIIIIFIIIITLINVIIITIIHHHYSYPCSHCFCHRLA